MFTPVFYSAVSSIVTGPLSFLFVVILTLEWRFSERVMKILIPAFLTGLSALCAVYFAVRGVSGSTKLHTAAFAIASFIVFNLLVSRHPVFQILSTYTTSCILTFLSDTVCGILVPQMGLMHVLAKIASFLVTAALLICFIRRPLLEVQREAQRKRWMRMMIVPALMCLIFFYVVQMQGPLYRDPAFRPVVLALCFCVVSVYLSFYFVLLSLQRQYRMQSETAVLQIHLSSLKKHAETMQAMSSQLQLLQHDLRHYIRIQSACLDSGDVEGMRQALDSLSRLVRDPSGSRLLRQYTGQTLIDAVLSYYADRAEEAGIDFQIRLMLPEELKDTSELAVMLSNAVENAYNACMAMNPDQRREIRLTGGVEARRFLLEIANTYGQKVRFDGKGHPVSQHPGHGYGTQSIVSYAEKNGAQLYYDAKDGWFRLRFLMELRELENH